MFDFDEQEIRKAIATFHPEGDLFEVRFVAGKWNSAGVFNNADTLIDAMRRARIRDGANAYMTLNSLNEACFDRSHKNTFIEYASPTVGDNDIDGYCWLLIDIDPCRPAGTSSTDEQLKRSREVAGNVFHWLKNKGWNDPIVCHSGNGTHLLYSVRLKNEPGKRQLVQNVLKMLGMLFSDDTMDIDQKVFNPARICKLYGTMARKGADTESRPHRMSRILRIPERLEPVDVSMLEAVERLLPQSEQPQKYNNYNPGSFDLQQWIDSHGIEVTDKVAWTGGTKWILAHCPFNPQHNHKDAAIIQTNDGKICFNCFHASCSGNHWREFRLFYEPDAYTSKDAQKATPNYMQPRPAASEKKAEAGSQGSNEPIFRTTEEIRQRVVPDEAHILTGIHGIDSRMIGLKKGFVTVLSGLRSSGKSSILSQLVLQCRQQGMKCALFSGEMIDKQVLKWLTLQAAGKAHVHGTQYEKVFYPNDNAAEAVSKWLNEFVYVYNNDVGNQYSLLERHLRGIVQEKQLDLVLIDNLMALNVEDLDKDTYSRQTKFVKSLKRMAEDLNIHVLFVAHPRKSNGYLRMDDISGSGDLSNAADNVFIIHRVDEDYIRLTKEYFHWKDSNPLYEADNVIEICKDRDLGNRDIYVPLYFEKETKRLKNSPAEYIHYGWESEEEVMQTMTPVIDPYLPF